jgi:hypothetical protein
MKGGGFKLTSALGYTEFAPLNLKAVFTNVDLRVKKVTTNIIYQDKTIATFIFSLPANIILESGDINSIRGLQEVDIDEEYVVWRLKPKWHSILEHEISEPDDFLV